MNLSRRAGYKRPLLLPILLFILIICAGGIIFQLVIQRNNFIAINSCKLHLLNTFFSDSIKEGMEPYNLLSLNFVKLITDDNEDLRLTYFDKTGRLIYDSQDLPALNNSYEKEIYMALKEGCGNSIRRCSIYDGRRYFFYALSTEIGVVRTALPYKIYLGNLFKFNIQFLRSICFPVIFIIFLGIMLSIWTSRRIVDEEKSEKNKMRRQMTNNINHELKTPVSSIRGYLETLINHPEMDEETKRSFIESCVKQSDRLSRLLQDVATITRMDEAPLQIDKEQIPLCDIIEDVINSTRQLQQQHGIVISTNFDLLESVFICGNEMLVESIFRNLIENSLYYSRGKHMFIDIIEENSEYVAFSVRDDGVGVEPKHLIHIFERFYRIDKGRSRKAGGTGLGLSIVKNAVLLHGGTISVSNQTGGGLCFEFTLLRQ
ncbi:MAG TPA: ATP-binding protein [Bacteroidaceae bacterium]|nr:ATP-binding protein [Bacteroidaceae bacterium]